jgi:hypothetical protein
MSVRSLTYDERVKVLLMGENGGGEFSQQLGAGWQGYGERGQGFICISNSHILHHIKGSLEK